MQLNDCFTYDNTYYYFHVYFDLLDNDKIDIDFILLEQSADGETWEKIEFNQPIKKHITNIVFNHADQKDLWLISDNVTPDKKDISRDDLQAMFL